MKILITGWCGYTGSILVPYLLKLGHKITVIDTMWFGNYLKKNSGLKIIKRETWKGKKKSKKLRYIKNTRKYG